jgi:hypothetical protein
MPEPSDELLAVMFLLTIVRFTTAELPYQPFPLPMPEHSSAQPIPAAAASREISTFTPSAINVTPLLETLITELELSDTPESRMTTDAVEMLRESLVELAVTTRSVTFDLLPPLQVSFVPVIVTAASLILQGRSRCQK